MKESIEIDGVTYIRQDALSTSVEKDGMKAVLIRSYAAGVHFGWEKSREHTPAGTLVTLVETRRVYSWQGAATLSQMALEGVKYPENCKFSVVLPENTIQNCIEIIPLTKAALESLQSVQVWKI